MIYSTLLAFKFIILTFNSLSLIYYFFKGSLNGILIYLVMLISITLIGFSTAAYFPIEIITISILINHFRFKKVNWLFLILLFQLVLTTILFENSKFYGNDFVYLAGFALLSLKIRKWDSLKNTIKPIILFLAYISSYVFFIVIKLGWKIFTFSKIDEGNNRLFEIETYLVSQKSNLIIDPNYLGVLSALGFIIVIILYQFYLPFTFRDKRKINFYKFIFTSRFVKVFLFILGFLFLLLTVRGFSRGALISLFLPLLYLAFRSYNFKYFLFFLTIVILFSNSSIGNIYNQRFFLDNEAGGRYFIWEYILDWTINNGFLYLGSGLNNPWWDNFEFSGAQGYGVHNSWLNIFLRLGLFTFFLFLFKIVRKAIYLHFSKNPLDKIKFILLLFVILAGISLDTMNTFFYWIVFSFSLSATKKITLK